jgi:cyclopropane-fatty-acyl-phospholipid synthase
VADLALPPLVAALRRSWAFGSLALAGPDGRLYRVQGEAPGLDAHMTVRDARFVRRVLTGGDIGFADSYVAGEWDSPDLPRLLTAFCANFDALGRLMDGAPLLRLANTLAHALRRNSRKGSRRNIGQHYDLGNAFYGLWLDEGMNYSSGLYADGVEDLAAAQRAKHRALAGAMDLRPGQSLLEVGCGWGDFALFAAREYGARVTAVTVSRAQHAHASARVRAEGLAERVAIELCDYRDIAGRFDRIASIEMFEAVGEAYWPTYFAKLAERLAPGGRAALQVITIDEALFEGYRSRPDFIQLHIFPGGMLPSSSRLVAEAARAGLQRTGMIAFGQDYARTLAQWARRYGEATAAVRAQGFDVRFDRLWRYYLAYCEAGFRTGRTDVVQLGLLKP